MLASGSAIHNTLGPPHVNFPEEEQPAAVYRYPMTIGDVLSGLRSVNLEVRTIDAVGTSRASLALLPAAMVPMLGRWLLPRPYRDHCALPEANSLRVLLGDYLLVVAGKPSNA